MMTNYIIPPKLNKGDEIRVISPSKSLGLASADVIESSLSQLKSMGFHVTFGKHSKEYNDETLSASHKSRLSDIHDAFKDKNVKAILTSFGGFNANDLISDIDYKLIKQNPKILCGYSDITVLQHALLAKSNLVTYSGPHFLSFGMKQNIEYLVNYFEKCLTKENPFEILPVDKWSCDQWYKNQNNRTFFDNNGFIVINPGSTQGIIVGSNLCSMQLLFGTSFWPNINEDVILFLEDCGNDSISFVEHFERDLQSLIHQNIFKNVKCIIFGRFQPSVDMSIEKLKNIISRKKELKNITIIANADFGHTQPIITYPIGGKCKITTEDIVKIKILRH